MTPTVLIVPGWGDSGPGHWQTLWQTAHPEFRRVKQRDWEYAVRATWTDALADAIREASGPAVLVAHSLGCHAVAHVAPLGLPITGALLVAPPDVERIDFPPVVEGFVPVPRARLPFASVVVASADDMFCDVATSHALADAWGSRFVNIGPMGHINTDAGFGPWPEGEALLIELLRR
ncbi:MAG: alpha/beta fold hydrolase [Candidatus Rokuibacteriota bacterium]